MKEQKVKILINTEKNKLYDVTEKKAIIYGAGKGCIGLVNLTELYSIEYIVDSDEKKFGETIYIGNRKFKIESPDIVKKLDGSEYYIIVSSEKYLDDIMLKLKQYDLDKNFLICKNKNNIHYEYESLQEMFLYDPLLKYKFINTHTSLYINQLMRLFSNIVKEKLPDLKINRYISLYPGSNKVTFIFGNNNELYVFSTHGFHNGNGFRTKQYDDLHKTEIYNFRTKYDVDKKITVYVDETGSMIQKYVEDNVDFDSDKLCEKVLNKMRYLHQIDEKISFENDVIERYIEKFNTAFYATIPELKKLNDRLQVPISILKEYNDKRLCHGGLYLTSIVQYNQEIFFIDWDALCMNDPYYDICLFLFSLACDSGIYSEKIAKLYKDLRKYLNYYLKRECTKKEYIHIVAMMILVESYRFLCLLEMYSHSEFSNMVDCILQHISMLQDYIG